MNYVAAASSHLRVQACVHAVVVSDVAVCCQSLVDEERERARGDVAVRV